MLYTGASLIPRPSHVFQCARENSGRPGRFGDVMMMYVPPFLQTMADTSSLHHQINQAFLIFLAYVEKLGKAWVQGYTEATFEAHW